MRESGAGSGKRSNTGMGSASALGWSDCHLAGSKDCAFTRGTIGFLLRLEALNELK